MLETFFLATALVALAEIGDKTQLLSLVLAAKYQRATPIIAGILVATLLNHFLAALLGHTLGRVIPTFWLTLAVGVGFILMGLWALIPDELDDTVQEKLHPSRIFITTLLIFFAAEMGDKTQVATVALAAKYQSMLSVVMGTTVGMLIANIPIVLLGKFLYDKLPIKLIHRISAAVFILLGIITLYRVYTG